jgi:hypothetical protein
LRCALPTPSYVGLTVNAQQRLGDGLALIFMLVNVDFYGPLLRPAHVRHTPIWLS